MESKNIHRKTELWDGAEQESERIESAAVQINQSLMDSAAGSFWSLLGKVRSLREKKKVGGDFRLAPVPSPPLFHKLSDYKI
ncbi:MAG: hypothetical protein N2D54_11660 [Chloroflexota bacterium]